ncbi:MAG TPA: hypothetical protein VI318_26325 [Baekduia sp.]
MMMTFSLAAVTIGLSTTILGLTAGAVALLVHTLGALDLRSDDDLSGGGGWGGLGPVPADSG